MGSCDYGMIFHSDECYEVMMEFCDLKDIRVHGV